MKQSRGRRAQPAYWTERATQYAGELAKMARPRSFEVFSTRRQMLRYLDFYVEVCPSIEDAVNIAGEVVNLLPAERPEDISPP